MRLGGVAALAGMTLLMPLSGASAQQGGKVCAATVAPLPGELAGWSARRPIMAAGKASGLRSATLEIGSAVDANLKPTVDIRYVARPEKPGERGSYGGLFAFTVGEAGTYRVALGSGAWIDVLRGRTAIKSTAHGHGPECSGIRKMVDFPLEPGRYTLQIAANGEPTLPMLIARRP
jgi:hypothetical protein